MSKIIKPMTVNIRAGSSKESYCHKMLPLLMLRQNYPRVQARQEQGAQLGSVRKRAVKDRHARLFRLNGKILDAGIGSMCGSESGLQ